jgi:hypothetical protein
VALDFARRGAVVCGGEEEDEEEGAEGDGVVVVVGYDEDEDARVESVCLTTALFKIRRVRRGTYEMIMARVKKYMRIESVIVLSRTSISLLKRFVIRPRGVVSKNDIGARSTLVMAR